MSSNDSFFNKMYYLPVKYFNINNEYKTITDELKKSLSKYKILYYNDNDQFRDSDAKLTVENSLNETSHIKNYFDNPSAKQIVQPIASAFPYQPHPRRSQLLQLIDFDDDNFNG